MGHHFLYWYLYVTEKKYDNYTKKNDMIINPYFISYKYIDYKLKNSTQGVLFRFECEYVAHYRLGTELITLLFSTFEGFKYLLRTSDDKYSRVRY